MTLAIVPLGGCGEVGLNATLFVYERQSILLDCGAFLGVQHAPGVNKIVPGFEPLFTDDRKLCGIVLTHGHEDHIGALPALLAERDAPVFGTPFTCDLVASRLERDAVVPAEARAQRARLTAVRAGGRFEIGPFQVEFISVTHSVPQSVAVRISTPSGTVLHTGDFRLDREPWDGRTTDVARVEALAEQGLDLLMSDSTNAERPGWGASERSVGEELERQIRGATGRVVVTLMGSHIHRMAALAEVARRTDRKLCLVGRALERNWSLGVEHGLLPSDPHLLVVPERLAQLPRDRALVLATGAQGESNGGLARTATGQDALLRLRSGELVIFSARTIPGHELAVRKIVNQLARQGVRTIQPHEALVHASGHACQDEQRALIEHARPQWFVPVYGEPVMLEAHARTARELLSEDRVVVVENGQSLLLEGGELRRGPRESISRRPLDGEGRVMDWGDIRERSRISRAGLVTCSVAVGRSGAVQGMPVVTGRGLALSGDRVAQLQRGISAALDDPHLISTEKREEIVRREIGRHFSRRKPQVEVHMIQLG